MKGKGDRKRYTQINAELQRIPRRDKKAFFNEQCKKKKKVEENNRRGKTRDLFQKIGNIKDGTLESKMEHWKYQKWAQ